MSTAARIKALARALRHAAGRYAPDPNECRLLANHALDAILRDDPSLQHFKRSDHDSDRAMRIALEAADLAHRSSAAELAASRRALLSP